MKKIVSKREQNRLDKLEKENQIKNLQLKIAGMSKWRKHYQDKIMLAKAEIVIKKKAPMPIELKSEFEQLPEWEEHLGKSYALLINEQILKMEVEVFDATMRIDMLNQEIKKLR